MSHFIYSVLCVLFIYEMNTRILLNDIHIDCIIFLVSQVGVIACAYQWIRFSSKKWRMLAFNYGLYNDNEAPHYTRHHSQMSLHRHSFSSCLKWNKRYTSPSLCDQSSEPALGLLFITFD